MDFTINAWESLYDAVDDITFPDRDADLIYQALEKRLRFISFGEYLRRYIYRKAGLQEPFADVPIKIYQQIIKESFAENCTPLSFTPTTAKLSALSKNWLTQQTVKRKVVFLLGFGLSMSVEDVEEFLTKALREYGINAKNPFEVICWYCYKNHYNYLKFEKMWNAYQENRNNRPVFRPIPEDRTIYVRNYMKAVSKDDELADFLGQLGDVEVHFSETAKRNFDLLYDEARDLIAALYNETEEEEKKHQKRIYERSDITESDFEHIICSAIPVDRHGNLTPAKVSKLNAQFEGKRFSRQHIGEIVSGKAEVTRFELITLNFFIYSQKVDEFLNRRKRYTDFIASTNEILQECCLGQLYIANPYECFVLMCILSEEPLATYADVWELSFGESL